MPKNSIKKIEKDSFQDYYMNLGEVMAYTGFGKCTIRAETRKGILRHFNRGGAGDSRWRKSDVDKWMETGVL